MAHRELNGKADFEAALATKDRFVFIYFYEGEIPAAASENAKKYAATTDAYSVDVGKNELPRQHFQIDKVPAVIVYRDGEVVKRVDEVDRESMKAVQDLLSG